VYLTKEPTTGFNVFYSIDHTMGCPGKQMFANSNSENPKARSKEPDTSEIWNLEFGILKITG
jgi:hypothetical protein